MKIGNRIWAGFALLALAGCGGGGDDASTPPAQLHSGEIDATYGTGGFALFTSADAFSEMAVAPDGSVYVTGASILKLDPNGKPDPTYGDAGRVRIAARSPRVDPQGNLYAISAASVIKLDSTGRLDQTFGNGGQADFAGTQCAHIELQRLARDTEGNIYVGGMGVFFRDPSVARLRPEGRGVTCLARVRPGSRSAYSEIRSVTFDGDRNVVIGGVFFQSGPSGSTEIVKFDRITGALLTRFSDDGIWKAAGCVTLDLHALAPAPSGGILYGGTCRDLAGLDRATARVLDGDGEHLASYQDSGFEIFGPTTPGGFVVESQAVRALLPHAGGHYAGGHRRGPYCQQGSVAKLDGNGRRIQTFSFNGAVALDGINEVVSLGADSAGRLYLGGFHFEACASNAPEFVVYRLGG